MKSNYLIIGESGSRRVVQFKDAMARRGLTGPRVVSYLDFISGSVLLNELVEPGDVVRIESPGKEFEVERALLRLGVQQGMRENSVSSNGRQQAQNADVCSNRTLTEREVDTLTFDRGLILPQSQWYRGWCAFLHMISGQLTESRPHTVMNSPSEIAILFDKAQSQRLLESKGVRMPALLGAVSSFEHLLELMESKRCHRVFLKPAHGSSASGVVAYQFSKGKHRAISTVELVEASNGLKLYNSRKVRSYFVLEEIRTLVDELCAHNLLVQKWYPKASINNKVFDLRVLVVSGKSRHVAVRESKTPFTNLHLLNARGQLSTVQEVLGEECYASVLETCERAASVFSNCLYVGVDVLISSDFKSHSVAEVNAFGDLLPGILCDGVSTYEAELDAMSDFASKCSGTVYV